MAEEDEVDIEGDFDLKIDSDDETCNIYDLNEPPSKTANLQPEFSQHPWMLEQGWSLDQVTDEKSKAVIEKMLLEEQQYNYKTRRKPPVIKQPAVQPKPKSKPSSVKKFWSEEEKELFLKGFLKFGRRWAKIADVIPGRTVQQVKNYGQQYLKTLEKKKGPSDDLSIMRRSSSSSSSSTLPSSLESSIALVTTAQPTIPIRQPTKSKRARQMLLVSTSEVVRIKTAEQLDSEEDEDIDILDSGDDAKSCEEDDNEVYRSLIEAAGMVSTALPATAIDNPEAAQEASDEMPNVDTDTNCSIDEAAGCTSQESERSDTPTENPENLDKDVNIDDINSQHATDYDEESSADEMPELENESWIMTSSGEMKAMPNPTEARLLKRDEISEEEKSIHTEFFDGRSSSKNAERYLKIRNHILDHWIKHKPGYVNKTVVRVGLKNCGDVNCIGRIHAYLEQIGAINFGCEQCQYNRPVKPSRSRKRAPSTSIPAVRDTEIAPRKRRVRDVYGSWIDEKDLQGQTIEHQEIKNGMTKKEKSRHSKDPFKLLPCLDFSESHPKPFDVVIEASVLVLMDVHAHQCKTEVIGMLGGKYSEDERQLVITMAQPCDSLSTHLQCEMDPVSQSQSCMHIMSKGHDVVGWYHSHPTFRPDPSIRDMETQAKYQAWFAQGGSPFVGVIISPYNSTGSSPSLHSQVRCLTASRLSFEGEAETDTGDPFKFNFETSREFWNSDVLLEEVRAVVEKYISNSSRVNLLNRYHSNSTVTCLEKLLASIERSLPLVEEVKDVFMAQLSEAIEEYYKPTNVHTSLMENLSHLPEDLLDDPTHYDVFTDHDYKLAEVAQMDLKDISDIHTKSESCSNMEQPCIKSELIENEADSTLTCETSADLTL